MKRRRREWKMQCALQSLGIRSQAAMLGAGGGGDDDESPGEMSDDQRTAMLTAAGFAVTRRPMPPSA